MKKRFENELNRSRARLLLDADLVRQFDELAQVPPLLFGHHSSVGAREINRDETFGGKRGTDNQLRFLLLRKRLRHGTTLHWARIVTREARRFVSSQQKTFHFGEFFVQTP